MIGRLVAATSNGKDIWQDNEVYIEKNGEFEHEYHRGYNAEDKDYTKNVRLAK